jgi:hypothetical protein
MLMFYRQDLLWRTAFLLGGKDCVWKQARKLVIMSEPKSTGAPPCLPTKLPRAIFPWVEANLITPRLSRMLHGRHIKDERKEKRIGSFTLGESSHQTGDAAFTPATPHDSHNSKANTDSHNSHNTQHTRVKQNALCFMQKGTQPSQTCSGGHITPNPTQTDGGDASLLIGSIQTRQ